MTERLYYQEPYRTQFDAVVQRVIVEDGRRIVILDRTAFYPTSGGQPYDIGVLAGVRVLDVIDRDDGTVAHVVDADLEAGQQVEGTIDWARRFDHMQQHTGQHVLSAAFVRVHQTPTVSFHLGGDDSTIDLARDLSPGDVFEAVREANRIVWENRLVAIRFATKEEALALPLRKESLREGVLRLIDIEDFDLSACGGTHVERTGAIGVIAVSAWERFKGGLRLHFVCGGRALAAFERLRDTVSGSVRRLSVQPDELPAAIDRLQAESKSLRRTLKNFQDQLAVHEAERLSSTGRQVAGAIVVVEALEGWDASGLKALAVALADRPSHAAILLTRDTPALIIVARSKGMALDSGAILRELIAKFGGKGGGNADIAQGGGLQGAPEALIEAGRLALESALAS